MQYEPLISDQYYHIFNRGNNREDILLEERNYNYFLSLVQKHILPVADGYAYCLLKNRFHLLIRTKTVEEEKKISRAFSNLFNAYAKAVNKAYNRTGSVFQDRFKRIVIKDETYLKSLILYIHLNPEYHSFVEDFRKYRHSSYHHIVSSKKSFLEKKNVLDHFGDTENFVQVHLMSRRSGPDIHLGESEF